MKHQDSSSLIGLSREEWFFYLVFVGVGIANVWFHELWRDEFQMFLIARESASISDLLQQMRYEGHPPLWALLLFLATRFSPDPLYLTMLHLTIACLSAFVIMNFPLPRWQKVSLIFGYFALYEFLALIRNYALGFLLFNTAVLLILNRTKRYILIASVLFLLSLTSVYGIMLAGLVSFYLAVDARGQFGTASVAVKKKHLAVGAFITFAGMALSIIAIYPPADRAVDILVSFDPENFFRRSASAFTAIWKSYVPVPPLADDFWNENIVGSKPLMLVLSLVLVYLSLRLFRRDRKVIVLYILGTSSLLAFSIFVYNSQNVRHIGHLYLVFFLCLALVQARRGREFTGAAGKLFIAFIMAAQVSAGAIASIAEWQYPFTAGKAAAEYIKGSALHDYVIIGDEDYPLTTLSGYLGKAVYHMSSLKPATYITWNSERQRTVEPLEIVDCANSIQSHAGKKVLVALNYELEPYETGNLVKAGEFTRGVLKDEKFYLYRINSEKPAGTNPVRIQFNPDDLVISKLQNRWAIVDSTNPHHVVAYFNQNRKSSAVNALLMIRHHGINEKYPVGNTSFYLVSGKAPSGSYPGEEVTVFDPEKIKVRKATRPARDGIPGLCWIIADGQKQLWNFGCNESAPEKAYRDFILDKGFTRLCRIGTFVYWRRE